MTTEPTVPESGLTADPNTEIAPTMPSEIDPEMLALAEQKLKEFKENASQTASGSEGVDPALDQLEIKPDLLHLYKRGQIEDVDGNPTWVTAMHEYLIISGNYNGEFGKRNKAGQYMRLDDLITEITNGPEGIMSIRDHGWRLSAILPNGSGMGVAILERNIKRVLPTPEPVKLKTEVAEVKDEELQRVNADSQQWAAGEQEAKSDSSEPATDLSHE